MRIDKCNSPLPETLNVSAESVSSTRIETFVSTSLKSLSRTFLDVTNFPSLPANGLLLTIKFIETVGSSIFTNGKASIWSVSQRVSPMFKSVIPEIEIISPRPASSASALLSPSNL